MPTFNSGDSLDVCVYKVMLDFKTRTLAEITNMVMPHGHSADSIKDSVVMLTHLNLLKRTTHASIAHYRVNEKRFAKTINSKVKNSAPLASVGLQEHNSAQNETATAQNAEGYLNEQDQQVKECGGDQNAECIDHGNNHCPEYIAHQPISEVVQFFARIKGVEFNKTELIALKVYLHGYLNHGWSVVQARNKARNEGSFHTFAEQIPIYNNSQLVNDTTDVGAILKYNDMQVRGSLPDTLQIKHTISFKGIELSYEEAQELFQSLLAININ